MSAVENLGSHLLGRIPSPADDRDYPLSVYLSDDPLRAALKHLTSSHLVTKSVKVWAKLVTDAIDSQVPPTPAPTPSGDVVWTDAENVLDQGQTPHCVGFGGAQWGNTLPVDDHLTNDDGHKLYEECKVQDGEPGQENGSTVRSLAKVLQARGRLKTYAFASTVQEITDFLDKSGPVIMGTDWHNDMFSPAPDGLVHPTGDLAGGHCYVAIGHVASKNRIRFLNSWSSDWGVHGTFEMTVDDVATLLAADGEACAAVELS